MDMSLHDALDQTAEDILRPLVQVLLNHGMAYGAFADTVRRVFVEEGFDHLARTDRRPTISAVSALTGLSRKEVKRLREPPAAGESESSRRYNRAVRVISGWVNDPRFQGDSGAPATLSCDGPDSAFAHLVRDYSGDVPMVAILTMLEGSGNVTREGDRVPLRQRAYLPMSTPLDKLNILGTDVAELMGTIAHNIAAQPTERLFQRKVSNDHVQPDAVAAFRELSREKAQHLLEELDQWLAAHEVDGDAADTEHAAYVAVGIYYTQRIARESN